MNDERINELIRNAKPQVDPAVRERIRAAIGPDGAAGPSRPGSLTLLMRAAALVILALSAGVVVAYFNRPPTPDTSLETRVSAVRERVESLEQVPTRDQIQELKLELELLKQQQARTLNRVIDATVNAELDARDELRHEEWRQRHIAHVRAHYAEEAEATVAAYRENLELSAAQEKKVRELLDEQGRKLEATIGDVYRGHFHHYRDHRVHEELEAISVETTEKLTALLDADQRENLPEGTAVISADPEHWAPTDDFTDSADVDALMNWITISEE